LSEQSAEQKAIQKEVKGLHSKPNNIEISALKTIEEYDKAYAERKVQATSKRDYIRTGMGYRACQRLLAWDSIVHPEKQKIRTVVNSMILQPVTIDGKRKFAIYWHGSYVGIDGFDSEIYVSFSTGYHYKPKLQFMVTDIAKPFDPQTGERRGRWEPVGYSYVHDIFVSENPKQRRKDIEKLIKTKDLDITNTTFSYRLANPANDHSSHHGECNRSSDGRSK
jgi:hypothetical protein